MSDLSFRALLRNLRLLAGLRGERSHFNVVITGTNANEVAAAMSRMEPSLHFQIAGDSNSAVLGASRVEGWEGGQQAVSALTLRCEEARTLTIFCRWPSGCQDLPLKRGHALARLLHRAS